MADKNLIIDDPDATLEQKVLALLLCTAQDKKVEIERCLEGAVLSLLQLNLLHALDKAPEGELTVSRLKGLLVDDNPNVSRTLNKLVEQGYIRKRRSVDDQRTVFVSITAAGKRAHAAGDARLMGLSLGLKPKKLEALYEILTQL